MSTKESSVNLVIRARNEADRAINTVTDALTRMFDTTEAGDSKLGALAASLASVDKAAATIQGAAAKGEQAFNSLGSSVKARKADLAALEAQASEAAAAIARLNGGDAIVSAGRDQGPRLAQLQTVQQAYERLQSEISRLTAAVAADEAKLNNSRSALQQLGSTAIGVAEGQARLRAEVELETAALNEQAEAAQRVTEAQARINAMTGVNRPATFDGKTAGQSAEVLAEAAARDALTKKYKEQAAEARNLAEAEAAEQANRVRFGITEDPKGAQAGQSAEVFKAAAAAAEEQAAAIRDGASAEEALDAKAEQLRASLNPMAALQEAFNARLREANQLFATGRISAEELRAKTAQLNAELKRSEVDMKRNGGSSIGIFGLRPYEVTNLGYQLNDVVTQLASGTSIAQTFAQQGGQILQILPGIGSKLLALATNPFFLTGAAAVGAIALGFKEIEDRAERLRGFEGLLTSIANGAEYSAAALAKNVQELQTYGVSAADATAAFKIFLADGLSPERFVQFGKTAKDMADVLGIKVPDAAKQLADGLTGGYAAIVKLDDATNFLTASQREHIRTLFDEGKAQEARAVAQQIVSDKMEKAAKDARGPWSDAILSLGKAWQSFLNILADTGIIKGVAEVLDHIAQGATNLINTLNGVKNATGDLDYLQKISDLEMRIFKAREIANREKNDTSPTAVGRRAGIADMEKELADLKAQSAAQFKKNQATDDSPIVDPKNTPEYKRSNDILDNMSKESQYQRLREKGANAVENLRNKAEAFESAAEQRRRVALAGELAATKAVGDERVKAAARAEAETRERVAIDKEKDAYDTANAAPKMQARNLLMGYEGFRSQAYWDRNHYRVGYGSSTTTDDGGNVKNVTQGTQTDRESAIRDLDRRIVEFQNVIKSQIGGERFGAFGPAQQAALTSIAYNYGKLPERILGAVKTGTSEQIAAAVRGLGNDNAGVNRGRRNKEADILATPNEAIIADNAKLEQEAEQRQGKLNVSIEEANAARRETTAELIKQAALEDTALIDERILAAGEKAVQDLERRVAEQNANLKPFEKRLELTKQQVEETRKLAVEEARAQAIRERASAATKEKTDPVDDLTAKRDALRQRIEYLRSQGNDKAADALEPQLIAVNVQLQAAIDKATTFYETMSDADKKALHLTPEKLDAIILKLKTAKDQAQEWGRVLGLSGESVAKAIANNLVSAFDKFAQAIGEGRNAFKALKDAFLDFAASFLRQIAQMIEQQLALNIARGILKAVGVSVPTNHSGGIAGVDATSRRNVSADWFAGAIRMHTGGVAGLAPDEVPTILQRNEEVLTASDPRHRFNGGLNPRAPAAGGNTRVINVFDAGAAVEAAMRTPAGEKAILNHVRDNPQAWNAALGRG